MENESTKLENVCWMVRDTDIFKGFSDSEWDPRPMLKNTREIRKIDYLGYCEDVASRWIDYIKEYLNDKCRENGDKIIDRVDLVQVCHTKDSSLRQDHGYFRLVVNRREVLDYIMRDSKQYTKYLNTMYETEQGYLSMTPSSPTEAILYDQFKWDLYFDYYVRSHINVADMTDYMRKASREVFMQYYMNAPVSGGKQ